jgi:ABC-type sugar transport system ATPase subunit
MIHQELALFPELTVAEHLVLDQLPGVISWGPIFHEAQKFLDGLGFDLRADARVRSLSIGSRQLVEIARALHRDARVLVFDEPTSALSEAEVQRLYTIIQRLRSEGRGILYITHRMDEVFELADRIVVLRDGRSVAGFRRGARSDLEPRLVKAMVGREIQDVYPARGAVKDEVALEVQGLSMIRPGGKQRLHGVSFEVRRGEVLGIAGLLGSGRSEILETLFGYYHSEGPKGPGYRIEGSVRVAGKPLRLGRPVDSLRAGLAFLSEDRKGSGLMLGQSILAHLELPALAKWGGAPAIGRGMEPWIRDLRIKCIGASQPVSQLSGGNQQKVVLAKWLETRPSVLFLDEPTRGVDIGAKSEIYEWIRKLSGDGMAIVLVSSELPELLGLSHRVLVLREGRVSGEFAVESEPPAVLQEKIMEAASL